MLSATPSENFTIKSELNIMDFHTQLYASRRAYVNEVENDRFVFFSPDNKGLPFVGQRKVKEVFDKYTEGRTILDVLLQDATEQQGDTLQLGKSTQIDPLRPNVTDPLRPF